MEHPPDDRYDGRRLHPQIAAALEAAGKRSADLAAPLRPEWTETAMRLLDRHGTLVVEVPLYRLHAVDDELVTAMVDELAAELGPGGAVVSVADDPAGDLVVIQADGVPVSMVHRSAVVEGWPLDDQPAA